MKLKIKLLFLLMIIFLCSCTKKTSTENKILETDLTEVTIIEVNNSDDMIISEEKDELIESEFIAPDITGRYKFLSIEIIKENNYPKIQAIYNGIEDVYLEIDNINQNEYMLSYYDPQDLLFFNMNNIRFGLPYEEKLYPNFTSKHEGNVIYGYLVDLNFGGNYIYFYYEEDKLIIDYLIYMVWEMDFMNMEVIEDGQLELKLIFEKDIETEITDIAGRYVFQSGNTIAFPGIADVYFDIEYINEDNYRFNFNDPKEIIFYRNERSTFKYPNSIEWGATPRIEYERVPFFRIDGELGGGGIYKHFFYEDDKIIIYIIDYLYPPPSEDDGDQERKLLYWYENEIIFQKVN